MRWAHPEILGRGGDRYGKQKESEARRHDASMVPTLTCVKSRHLPSASDHLLQNTGFPPALIQELHSADRSNT